VLYFQSLIFLQHHSIPSHTTQQIIMFSEAYKLAFSFTKPVMVAIHDSNGETKASVGTFTVINDEGWIVTAAHIINNIGGVQHSLNAQRTYEQQSESIQNDSSLSAKERRRQISKLVSPGKASVKDFAMLWGFSPSQLQNIKILPAIDLAVGQLVPFEPSWVQTYPVIKDPSKNFNHGTNLCRFGFPLSEITPVYSKEEGFRLDAPLPIFPNEGIFTRVINIPKPEEIDSTDVELAYLETSSPGLLGQSGGPIVDTKGAIWAIQSSTKHYPLGFDAKVKEGNKTRSTEHSFLHVGWGIHAKTLVGFLQQNHINFRMSDY
jgi:hypothetical protein